MITDISDVIGAMPEGQRFNLEIAAEFCRIRKIPEPSIDIENNLRIIETIKGAWFNYRDECIAAVQALNELLKQQ